MRLTPLFFGLFACQAPIPSQADWLGPVDPAWAEPTMPDIELPTPPTFTLEASQAVLGSVLTFDVSGAPPNSLVKVAFSFSGIAPGPCFPFMNGRCFNLAAPLAPLPGTVITNAQGSGQLSIPVPITAPGPYVSFQALDLATGHTSNALGTQLFSPGATTGPNQDLDNDGFTPATGDCADSNGAINPFATDIVFDGIDQNCDGADGVDQDGDGYANMATGGTDCDDSDAELYPYDLDGDGIESCDGDCDDTNPGAFPGASESCDGSDNDCDGVVDASSGISACFTTESFPVGTGDLDVLLVIDDSGSMAPYQSDLSTVTDELLTPSLNVAQSVHVGIVTTDMVDPLRSGQLLEWNGVRFADSLVLGDAGLLVWTSGAITSAGTVGNFVETGLDAIQAALSPPLVTTGVNAGFYRPDADLAVILLTDEPDQGGSPTASYIAGLNFIQTGPGPVQVHGFLPLGPSCGSTLVGRYEAVINAFGGQTYDICVPNYAAGASAIGQSIVPMSSPTQLYSLQGVPDPATLEVTVEYGAGGSATLSTSAWIYDPTNNSVEVIPSLSLGDSVFITYDFL
ncbi:MAG: MopE-related protein [Myxococcota bacterium]